MNTFLSVLLKPFKESSNKVKVSLLENFSYSYMCHVGQSWLMASCLRCVLCASIFSFVARSWRGETILFNSQKQKYGERVTWSSSVPQAT